MSEREPSYLSSVRLNHLRREWRRMANNYEFLAYARHPRALIPRADQTPHAFSSPLDNEHRYWAFLTVQERNEFTDRWPHAEIATREEINRICGDPLYYGQGRELTPQSPEPMSLSQGILNRHIITGPKSVKYLVFWTDHQYHESVEELDTEEAAREFITKNEPNCSSLWMGIKLEEFKS